MAKVDITEDFWIGYMLERAYASGRGDTVLLQTPLQTADLVSLDRVVACNITYNVPEREEQHDIGSGINPSYIQDLARNPGEITLKCYLQTDNFYDLATFISGYQENGLVDKVVGTATGLSTTTDYSFKVNIDGIGILEWQFTTGADVTYAAVIALANAATRVGGGAAFNASGAFFSLVGGDLRCTSETAIATSAISLSAGTTDTDFFGTLTDWTAFETAVSGATQRLGQLPKSIAIHVDTGIVEQDLFGCVITSWKVESVTKIATYQTIVISFRDTGNGGTLTKKAYETGAPSVHSDVSYTIDAKTSANLYSSSVIQTITNVLNIDAEGYALGDAKLQLPVLKERNVEIEIIYKDRNENTWGAGNNLIAAADELIAATYFNAVIIWFTTLTSTMTNVYLLNTNSGDRNTHGLITHKATFKRGVGFTIN